MLLVRYVDIDFAKINFPWKILYNTPSSSHVCVCPSVSKTIIRMSGHFHVPVSGENCTQCTHVTWVSISLDMSAYVLPHTVEVSKVIKSDCVSPGGEWHGLNRHEGFRSCCSKRISVVVSGPFQYKDAALPSKRIPVINIRQSFDCLNM